MTILIMSCEDGYLIKTDGKKQYTETYNYLNYYGGLQNNYNNKEILLENYYSGLLVFKVNGYGVCVVAVATNQNDGFIVYNVLIDDSSGAKNLIERVNKKIRFKEGYSGTMLLISNYMK